MAIIRLLILMSGVVLLGANVFAGAFAGNYLLPRSEQLIQVTVNNLKTTRALIQLYQRSNYKDKWRKYGKSFPAVIGLNGASFHKHEGDNKTPIGTFPISTAFGIAKYNRKITDIPYIHITPDTVCVDDFRSRFYNTVVNSSKVAKKDWHSREQMYKYSKRYKFGLVVGYNKGPSLPHNGSCIFMHIWASPNQGTAGCIAMSEKNIRKLLKWLKPNNHSVLAVALSDAKKPL